MNGAKIVNRGYDARPVFIMSVCIMPVVILSVWKLLDAPRMEAAILCPLRSVAHKRTPVLTGAIGELLIGKSLVTDKALLIGKALVIGKSLVIGKALSPVPIVS